MPVTPALEPASPGRPWALALLVIGVLGLAHVGLFLLLTAASRSDIGTIEARYTREELESERPREAGPNVTAAARESRRAELGESARAWRNDRRHVATIGWALFASFAVQAGVIVWIRLGTRSAKGTPSAG